MSISDDDDAYYREVDEWLRFEAEARGVVHGERRRGIIGPERDYRGLRGEIEFGQVFKQYVDLRRLREGDKGIDFTVPLRTTIDVRASARREGELLVPVDTKYWADIYVRAYFNEAEGPIGVVELQGWEWGAVMRKQPVKDLGHGPNHWRKVLRPIPELAEQVMYLR